MSLHRLASIKLASIKPVTVVINISYVSHLFVSFKSNLLGSALYRPPLYFHLSINLLLLDFLLLEFSD